MPVGTPQLSHESLEVLISRTPGPLRLSTADIEVVSQASGLRLSQAYIEVVMRRLVVLGGSIDAFAFFFATSGLVSDLHLAGTIASRSTLTSPVGLGRLITLEGILAARSELTGALLRAQSLAGSTSGTSVLSARLRARPAPRVCLDLTLPTRPLQRLSLPLARPPMTVSTHPIQRLTLNATCMEPALSGQITGLSSFTGDLTVEGPFQE